MAVPGRPKNESRVIALMLVVWWNEKKENLDQDDFSKGICGRSTDFGDVTTACYRLLLPAMTSTSPRSPNQSMGGEFIALLLLYYTMPCFVLCPVRLSHLEAIEEWKRSDSDCDLYVSSPYSLHPKYRVSRRRTQAFILQHYCTSCCDKRNDKKSELTTAKQGAEIRTHSYCHVLRSRFRRAIAVVSGKPACRSS